MPDPFTPSTRLRRALLGSLERFFGEWGAGQREIPIARRLPLSKAAEAHRLLQSGETFGKILLTI